MRAGKRGDHDARIRDSIPQGSEPMTSVSIAQGASRTHAAAGAVTHVKYLDHFRALAILQIVLLHAGHAFLLRGFESPLPESNPVFRSEEHTSELQSLMRISYAVFCLKKTTIRT